MGAFGKLFSGSWSDLTGWLHSNKKPKAEERRREFRLPVHGRVVLDWAESDGERQSLEAHLMNVSSGGFEVRCPRSFEPGTSLRIVDPTGRIGNATVLRSSPDDAEFLVGGQVTWQDADKDEQAAEAETSRSAA